MKEYFIHDGNSQRGPFNIEQLKSQPLKKDTPIWFEGLENWTTAGHVEELKALFSFSSIPPPLNIPFSKSYARDSEPQTKTTYFEQSNKKKSLSRPMLFWGAVIIIAIIAWLIYQNREQQQILNTVQQKESQKEMEKDNEDLMKVQTRNSWSKYIGITRSPYTYSQLGGIDEFDVYVKNNTEYILDEVQVTVKYIKEAGGVFKIETITIYNIPPNTEKTGKAPSSSRGTSIDADITGIISKNMEFCFPHNSGRPDDRYFCK